MIRDIGRYRFLNNDNVPVEERLQDLYDVSGFIDVYTKEFSLTTRSIEVHFFNGVTIDEMILNMEQAIEQERQRWVAVAMSRHRRLGSDASMGS